MRRNQRSAEAQEYRKLYKTAAWRRIRQYQLATQPLCERCKAEGKVTPATVCNHVIPHRGDRTLFFEGPFESLCADHHDRVVQSEERLGYSKAIGEDGFPLDSRHPFNRNRRNLD
ncbi:MAG: hypothetical protein MI861_13315 [Pirellulales bacterium]|nr:hypothetical protein [Pirellulales bacterium]